MRQAQQDAGTTDALDALVAHVLAEGSAKHRWPISDALHRGAHAARNAADAVHHLAHLHGRHPGVIAHAAQRTADPIARAVIEIGARQFADERALLARLVMAAGPLPSTPGHADSESAVFAQHHAIEMLAQSDRNGCATGAALALIVEWATIRPLLDAVALRLGLEVSATQIPPPGTLSNVLESASFGTAAERAMVFGAQQIVVQHWGLWDLLEARAIARDAH